MVMRPRTVVTPRRFATEQPTRTAVPVAKVSYNAKLGRHVVLPPALMEDLDTPPRLRDQRQWNDIHTAVLDKLIERATRQPSGREAAPPSPTWDSHDRRRASHGLVTSVNKPLCIDLRPPRPPLAAVVDMPLPSPIAKEKQQPDDEKFGWADVEAAAEAAGAAAGDEDPDDDWDTALRLAVRSPQQDASSSAGGQVRRVTPVSRGDPSRHAVFHGGVRRRGRGDAELKGHECDSAGRTLDGVAHPEKGEATAARRPGDAVPLLHEPNRRVPRTMVRPTSAPLLRKPRPVSDVTPGPGEYYSGLPKPPPSYKL